MEQQNTRKRKRRRRQSLIPFVIFVAVILCLSLGLGLAFRYKPSTQRYNLRQYFGVQDNTQVAVVLNNERQEEAFGLLREGRVFFPYETVVSLFNDRFYWESSRSQLLYTLPDQIAVCELGTELFLENETLYLSMALVRQYTPMEYAYYEDPARVVIDLSSGTYTQAEVRSDDAVRYRGGVKSPILTDVSKGETLRILEEGDDWTRVSTTDGFIGYIQKKRLTNKQELALDIVTRNDGYTSLVKDKPVNLVWHQVTNQSQNENIQALLAGTQAVTTVSPTWFYLNDNWGGIASLASRDYVSYVHSLGMEVWGLVDNFTADVDTEAVLSNPDSRKQLIDNLMVYAVDYGLDGINVDFEHLTESCGPFYIQFIREMYLRCHANGLVLSVDNPVPFQFNSFYNLSEQAVFADYVIVMSYDEHLNASTGAGSVASLEYVTGSMDRALQKVPAGKLINAIPFYTRIWKEIPKTDEQIAGEGATSGDTYEPYTLSWDTLGMAKAKETLNTRDVNLQWDETLGQFYGEYQLEDGTSCKVWMEEEQSIQKKLDEMKKRNIAGVAGWKLGLESPGVWPLLAEFCSQ